MADYWDEHGIEEDDAVEDVFDFIRRLNSGQLPEHWHLDDFADVSLPPALIRRLFSDNPDATRKTAVRFLEKIEENDGFPGE